MIIAAIDPGLTGAVAIFRIEKDDTSVEIHKMPTHIISLNNLEAKTKRDINIVNTIGLQQLLLYVDVVIIEKIIPYIKDSRVSCFSFGGAFHSMLTAFKSLQSVHEVDPKVWKKTFSLMNTDKDCVVERAIGISDSLISFKLPVLPSTKHTRIAFCDAYLIGIHYLQSIKLLKLGEIIRKQITI